VTETDIAVFRSTHICRYCASLRAFWNAPAVIAVRRGQHWAWSVVSRGVASSCVVPATDKSLGD